MRLKESHVKQICQSILAALRTSGQITIRKSESEVMAKMESIFIAELKIEDDINREAYDLLEKYAREMGDKIDREKMFQMIKKQLVKDRKVIL